MDESQLTQWKEECMSYLKLMKFILNHPDPSHIDCGFFNIYISVYYNIYIETIKKRGYTTDNDKLLLAISIFEELSDELMNVDLTKIEYLKSSEVKSKFEQFKNELNDHKEKIAGWLYDRNKIQMEVDAVLYSIDFAMDCITTCFEMITHINDTKPSHDDTPLNNTEPLNDIRCIYSPIINEIKSFSPELSDEDTPSDNSSISSFDL